MSIVIFIAGILVVISQLVFKKLISGKEEEYAVRLLLPWYLKYIGAGILIMVAFLPLDFYMDKYQIDSSFRDLIIVFSIILVAASSERRNFPLLAGLRYFTLMSSISSIALVYYVSILVTGQPKTEPDGLRLLAAVLFLYVATYHMSKKKLKLEDR